MNKKIIQFVAVEHYNGGTSSFAHHAENKPINVRLRLVAPYYYLKSFYKLHGKHYSNYEWLPPVQVVDDTEKFCTDIINKNVDIVCLSLYAWSNLLSLKIAKILKSKNPDIIIIGGGPDIQYEYLKHDIKHNNKQYNIPFKKLGYDNDEFDPEEKELARLNKIYNDFDYLIYDDGEESFKMLLDNFIEPIDEKSIPNLITKDFISHHSFFKFEKYEPYSPYLTLKEEFIEDYNRLSKTVEHEIQLITVVYEVMRGCPYACTFCSDRIGRVTKKNYNWKNDIDFLSQFDNLLVHVVDTNSGINEEYVKFYEYAAQYVREGWNIHASNMAKLGAERFYKISKILSSTSNQSGKAIKVAVQHLDEQVLKNIDRPSMKWSVKKEILQRISQETNEIFTVELIQGLPGVRIENSIWMFEEFITVPMHDVSNYQWEYLSNSIASLQSYRDKHNLKLVDSVVLNYAVESTVEEIYTKTLNEDFVDGTSYSNMMYEDNYIYDYFYISHYAVLYNLLCHYGLIKIPNVDERLNKYRKCVSIVEPLFKQLTKYWVTKFEREVEKYGMFVWGNEFKGKTYNWATFTNLAIQQYYGKKLTHIIKDKSML